MPRKPKRRKWGSIRTVSKNKHVLRWVENTSAGRVRKCHTFHGTETEASLWLDRKHVELADSGDKPVPTIGKAYEMWYRPWLKRKVDNGSMKASSAERYTIAWDNVVSKRWRDVPIGCERPADVQEWLLTLSKGNAKVSLTVLRKIYDFAVRFEVCRSNRMREEYEIPASTTRSKAEGSYSLEEAHEAFLALRGAESEAPFILMCFGSARVGESLGVMPFEIEAVTCRGIDFAAVRIVRQMPKTGASPKEDGDLKTPESTRTLLIPYPYGGRLIEIAESRSAIGSEWVADRGDGFPMNQNALMLSWKRDAGTDWIPPSNLRRSWRTFAQYEWGVDYNTLEILMGHKLQGVTGRHYLKPSIDQMLDRFAKALSESDAYRRLR